MCFIQKDDGDIIHDSNLITQEVKTFYENLYASRENKIIHCNIDNINTPTLSQEESDSLEGPVTLQEALSSIKQMKNDKSPGSDGFTAEFFKFFFTDLGTFMVRSINYVDSGQMSVTQRQGVIVCIPKEGKDFFLKKNWRPITPLNTVYKIAFHALLLDLRLFCQS